MPGKYKTEKEISALVKSFETGAIARDEWRHAEHLTVALYYLFHHDYDTSLVKMRGGIFNLLRSFGVDLSKEMPYHETLTVFWIRTISDFKKSKNGASIIETCHELVEKFDKNYPFRFYSRELLFSDEARSKFVEADLDGKQAAG
ncbi:MAG TPA: hypothetical protein VGC76_07385 [Pyrinomonadaceae bacterium]|jgi:hypothetical protein